MSKLKQLRIAKIAGVSYFALLGVVNLVATWYFSTIRPVDFIILILCVLPMLVSKKNLLLQAVGFLGLFLSLYGLFAAITFNTNLENTTTQTQFNLGYLLIGSGLLASVALIYAGSQSAHDQKSVDSAQAA